MKSYFHNIYFLLSLIHSQCTGWFIGTQTGIIFGLKPFYFWVQIILKLNQELNAGLSSRGNFIMIGDMVYTVSLAVNLGVATTNSVQ
jgi:hypothetical protein